MTADDLERAWSSLDMPSSAEQLNGRRVTDPTRGVPVWVALDGTGRRHLLVEVPQGLEPLRERPTKGLQVLTDELLVGERPSANYIDLICLDTTLNTTFTAVAQEVMTTVAA